MSDNVLTPLENAVLSAFGQEFPALPSLDGIAVVEREHSGAGRFTTLKWSGLPDGAVLVQSGRIRLESLSEGLGAVLFTAGTSACLELHTFAGDWDGNERDWKIE